MAAIFCDTMDRQGFIAGKIASSDFSDLSASPTLLGRGDLVLALMRSHDGGMMTEVRRALQHVPL